MRQAVGAVLLACAFVGCAEKRSAVPRENDLVAARAAWLAEWRKGHTYELAEEFLGLYGRNVRAAEPDSYPGRVYGGRAADVDMTGAQIDELLGGADDGTDLYCDYLLGGGNEALLRVEDPRLTGDPEDTRPVVVKVVRVIVEGSGVVAP